MVGVLTLALATLMVVVAQEPGHFGSKENRDLPFRHERRLRLSLDDSGDGDLCQIWHGHRQTGVKSIVKI